MSLPKNESFALICCSSASRRPFSLFHASRCSFSSFRRRLYACHFLSAFSRAFCPFSSSSRAFLFSSWVFFCSSIRASACSFAFLRSSEAWSSLSLEALRFEAEAYPAFMSESKFLLLCSSSQVCCCLSLDSIAMLFSISSRAFSHIDDHPRTTACSFFTLSRLSSVSPIRTSDLRLLSQYRSFLSSSILSRISLSSEALLTSGAISSRRDWSSAMTFLS